MMMMMKCCDPIKTLKRCL